MTAFSNTKNETQSLRSGRGKETKYMLAVIILIDTLSFV